MHKGEERLKLWSVRSWASCHSLTTSFQRAITKPFHTSVCTIITLFVSYFMPKIVRGFSILPTIIPDERIPVLEPMTESTALDQERSKDPFSKHISVKLHFG